jgi:phosphocarrier protein
MMYSKTTTVISRTGMHARPASNFIAAAGEFSSDIWINKPEGKKLNAKSIVMLLFGGFKHGDTVIISAEGEDEQAAVDSLIALIDSGLNDL